MLAAALGLQEFGYGARIRLAQAHRGLRRDPARRRDHLAVQLGIGRKRDRLLLGGGVEHDFLFFRLGAVQGDPAPEAFPPHPGRSDR